MVSNFSKNKPTSQIVETLNKKQVFTKNENFKVSFQYLDTTQKFGSSFRDWQKCGLLSKMLETLQGYCNKPLTSQFDGYNFKAYDGFPQADFTMFKCPANIPEDAHWARIHILNKTVVVGHYVGNTFFVVFLDKTHKFYLTKKDRNNLK